VDCGDGDGHCVLFQHRPLDDVRSRRRRRLYHCHCRVRRCGGRDDDVVVVV